ncbi:uncharacterized protein LOC127261339 [Andrographis paniculata]|uniref:uncharacterized protein LOC127261339 n=1 Tax=Andrographis paniculata TaxID=175694 RepID=UPI0021E8467D|nr:uncharacterized protein LOC127261339 [Andrographis paniculata]
MSTTSANTISPSNAITTSPPRFNLSTNNRATATARLHSVTRLHYDSLHTESNHLRACAQTRAHPDPAAPTAAAGLHPPICKRGKLFSSSNQALMILLILHCLCGGALIAAHGKVLLVMRLQGISSYLISDTMELSHNILAIFQTCTPLI